MAFTHTWNAAYEALPADADNISDGATKIRNFKNAIRERLSVDHYYAIAGTDADHGEHTKITFHSVISTPAAVTGKSFLYTKSVGSLAELTYEYPSGAEISLTRDGYLAAATGFSNGTYPIIFPTNNMSSAKIMLGNSSTILWMYLSAAPPGWKIVVATTGLMIGIGAGGTISGSTTISGLTVASVTSAPVWTGFEVPGHGGTSGDQAPLNHYHTMSPTVTSDGNWRPYHYTGNLFQLDTT